MGKTEPAKNYKSSSSIFADWSRGDRIGAIIVLLAGLIILMMSGSRLIDNYRIINSFARTTASFAKEPEAYRTGGRRTRHTEFRVSYRFTVNGRSYEGTDSIKTRPIYSDIQVYYNQKNPAENVAELPETWIGWSGLALGAIFIGAIIFWIIQSLYRSRINQTKSQTDLKSRDQNISPPLNEDEREWAQAVADQVKKQYEKGNLSQEQAVKILNISIQAVNAAKTKNAPEFILAQTEVNLLLDSSKTTEIKNSKTEQIR
jgi:hypothetical protein